MLYLAIHGVCVYLETSPKSPLMDLAKENVHTRTLGVRVPCYGCVCMCARLYIMFVRVCVMFICVNVCVGAFVTLYLCKNKSRHVRCCEESCRFSVYSVWMLSGHVGDSCCSILF